jgi:hypothetical protein
MNGCQKFEMFRSVPKKDQRNYYAKVIFWLIASLVFFAPEFPAQAAAPARSGQPYAESICNTDPNILFCEDFNYPQNFVCTLPVGLLNHRWINPGWAQESTDFVYCGGRQINPSTNYPAKPQGAMAGSAGGDYVWTANWDPTKGTVGSSASYGKLRLPGGNYVNGLSPATDIYIRFQIYFTSNWAWPGDPKTDKYAFSSGNCIDNKFLFIYPPEGLDQPTNASYDAGPYTNCMTYDPVNNAKFGDALAFRVGTNSDNYKQFPLCTVCSSHPAHNEYAPYQSLTFRNPHDQTIFGRVFRFDTNRWYSLEFRYKFGSSSGAQDGTIEAWIDGTKIYSGNDLETCTASPPYGDCSGVGAMILMAYHNAMDPTAWNGQQVIDNLIVSKSYIGPPGGAVTPPASPTAPTGLSVQ